MEVRDEWFSVGASYNCCAGVHQGENGRIKNLQLCRMKVKSSL